MQRDNRYVYWSACTRDRIYPEIERHVRDQQEDKDEEDTNKGEGARDERLQQKNCLTVLTVEIFCIFTMYINPLSASFVERVNICKTFRSTPRFPYIDFSLRI